MKKLLLPLFISILFISCKDNSVEPQKPVDDIYKKIFVVNNKDTLLLMTKESINLFLAYDGFVTDTTIRIRYTGLNDLSNIALMKPSYWLSKKYFFITLNKWQFWTEILAINEDQFIFKFLKDSPN